MSNDGDWFDRFIGQIVCADLKDGFVIFGTLISHDQYSAEFKDADFHDPREGNSSKDVYALETRSIGVRVNRKQCYVDRNNIISICLLSDLE